MGYVLITPPDAEAISLADAKLHLRADTSADDALISALSIAARQYAEQITTRSFVTQSWKLVLDTFPYGDCGYAIQLEKGPVQSVTAVTYVDMAGATQTMPAADYVVDTSGPLARVTPVFGKVWPIPLPQIGSVSVTFVAGYGGAPAVPAGIRQWMLLRIGAMYETRSEVAVGRGIQITPLPFYDSLLEPYTVVRA